MSEEIYTDTATDTAIAHLLMDISTGVGIGERTKRLLTEAAGCFQADIAENHRTLRARQGVADKPSFPIMVASSDDGAIAYCPSEACAKRIADALVTEVG